MGCRWINHEELGSGMVIQDLAEAHQCTPNTFHESRRKVLAHAFGEPPNVTEALGIRGAFLCITGLYLSQLMLHVITMWKASA